MSLLVGLVLIGVHLYVVLILQLILNLILVLIV